MYAHAKNLVYILLDSDPPSQNATTTFCSISLKVVSRWDWLAQDADGVPKKLDQPIPWVIISHTGTKSCLTQSKGWDDIGYNFLIGGDGSVYNGRGWDNQGAHTSGYNKKSIGIAFIGTYNQDPPTERQVEACKNLKQGVEQGKLRKDYKLFGQRQLASTFSPGDKVFDVIKKWPHFERTCKDFY